MKYLKILVPTLMIIASLTVQTEESYAATLLVGQSAKWVATGSRAPTQEIDAVWFNPAGTTELEEGLHLSFSHHQLFAHGHIENDTVLDNSGAYGEVADKYPMGGYVPYLFYLYMAYRTDDWSYMFSIESPGGIGGGEMPKGTPTEEVGFYLGAYYSGTAADEGMKINSMEGSGGGGVCGPAIGVAYKLNENVSVSIKARFLIGFNYMEGTYDVVYIGSATGEKKYTFDDGGDTIKYTGLGYGYGFGGGVNYKPIDGLNISLAVDWFSKLEQTIKFQNGDMKRFPATPYDGMKYRNQIPTRIGIGVGYVLSQGSTIMLSYDLGLDKYADQEGDLNSSLHDDVPGSNAGVRGYPGEEFGFQHQLGLGIEYKLNNTYKITTGAGYLKTALKPLHQKDFYQWPDRYDLHIGTEITFSEDTQLVVGYCIYVSLPSKGNLALFKYDGDHVDENGDPYPDILEKGAQSEYTRYAHILGWSITTKW